MATALIETVNLAAIYALVAVGISLTWSGLRFLNLGHGMTFAVSGYAAWWVGGHVSSSAPAILVGGVVAGALVGALICVVVFLQLEGRPNFELRSLIATLALSLIGGNALLQAFGPYPQGVPAIFGHRSFRLGNAVVTPDKYGAVISAIVILTLLMVALKRSKLGLSVRALTQNAEGAQLVGINRRMVAVAILAGSGALAGLAAVLLSQTFFVGPSSGDVPLIDGLIVALLGGLGSLGGTIVAAVLIAAASGFTDVYLGGQYDLAMQFALIAFVLVIRPRGLGGILETVRA
jgi:branched-chain amino acid transport system permease protein